jgi:hypothetical protein
MQFYKYQAALLLESRGGEGGEAIPDVSVIPSFLTPPRTRSVALLMYPCIRTTSQSLPFLLVLLLLSPLYLILIFYTIPSSLPISIFILHLFSYSSCSNTHFYIYFFFYLFFISVFLVFFLFFFLLHFLGCAGNFGRNRNTYGSPGCSSICPCYCPSPRVSASVSAGHSARTHDDTDYHR